MSPTIVRYFTRIIAIKITEITIIKKYNQLILFSSKDLYENYFPQYLLNELLILKIKTNPIKNKNI